MIGRPFQRGTSGNPGGRPRAAHNIQELARKHAPEALDVLVQIMLNEKAPGAVKQGISASDTGIPRVDLSDDEVAAIVAKAKLTLVK